MEKNLCTVQTKPTPMQGQAQGLNGQVAMSALGFGRACSFQLSAPTVHTLTCGSLRSTHVSWPVLPPWIAWVMRASGSAVTAE